MNAESKPEATGKNDYQFTWVWLDSFRFREGIARFPLIVFEIVFDINYLALAFIIFFSFVDHRG